MLRRRRKAVSFNWNHFIFEFTETAFQKNWIFPSLFFLRYLFEFSLCLFFSLNHRAIILYLCLSLRWQFDESSVANHLGWCSLSMFNQLIRIFFFARWFGCMHNNVSQTKFMWTLEITQSQQQAWSQIQIRLSIYMSATRICFVIECCQYIVSSRTFNITG